MLSAEDREAIGQRLLAALADVPSPCPAVLLPLAERAWQKAIVRDFPVMLPVWSAQVAGSPADLTIDAAAAWAGLYLAAKLLDDLQDGDPCILGPATEMHTALNLATGLLFASGTCLAGRGDGQSGLRNALARRFYRQGLEVAAGQELGMLYDQATDVLDWAWKVLIAKGGRPFSLACSAGALSAGAPEATAAVLAEVGQCIGEMVQLLDDLIGMQSADARDVASHSMPIAFGLSVMEGDDEQELKALLGAARSGATGAVTSLFGKLEEMGAVRYLRIEASARALRARELLESSCLDRHSAGWVALGATIDWLDPVTGHDRPS